MKVVFWVIIAFSACSGSSFSQGLLRPLPANMLFSPYVMGGINRFSPKESGNVPAIPRNFYTYGLGFFCRQELKMQQVHVPVAFRIGTMDNCNYLEQKPGYRETYK